MPLEFRLDERRFNQLALLATLVGFGLLVVAFAVTIVSAMSNQRATLAVRHTYRVIEELNMMSLAIERVETATRGYLLAPSPIRAETRRRNTALIGPSLGRLQQLTADNPRQQRTIAALRTKVSDQVATTTDMMNRAEAGQIGSARAEFVERVKIRQIDQIRELENAVRSEEMRLLSQRQSNEAAQREQFSVILAATGLLMLLVGAATYVLVRRYTRDLTTTRDRLNRLNVDLEGAVAERTADLQRANDEIQRFAYIVSHDLRSPLVNVMGFTSELEVSNKSLAGLIERAETEAPQLLDDNIRNASADLPEAIGFIRSSTQKMDRLINAILKISREGRRALVPERLPMQQIVDDIVASVAHRAAEAGAELHVEPGLPDIVSDRLAVEQVLSNLVDNAIKYLSPERPGRIEIRGRSQAGRALFDVRDNGRGIDQKDHERVFELFRRSGTQDKPGEGIGLAHVRALAYRLGGTVTVQSALGEGATFRLDLPVTYAEQGVKN